MLQHVSAEPDLTALPASDRGAVSRALAKVPEEHPWVLEPTGSETQIFARMGEDTIDAVVKDRISARPGEEVAFRIDPRRVHIFDRQTSARL